jgi:hypothetical protein
MVHKTESKWRIPQFFEVSQKKGKGQRVNATENKTGLERQSRAMQW